MNSIAFNLEDIVYEEFDDEEVNSFKEIGKKIKEKLKVKSHDVKKAIAYENKLKIDNIVVNELETGEEIQCEGRGYMTWVQYLSSTGFSADYYMCPMIGWDVGLSYYTYFSDKKLMIYEVGKLNELQRQYVINNEDISKLKLRNKKKYTYLSFYSEKDKYDQLRMCSSPWLYYFLHNRTRILFDKKYSKELTEYFSKYFEGRVNKKFFS